MRRALRWSVAIIAALWSCVPSPPATAPDADSGTCAQACDVRAKAGCLEPALAPRCVPTCERARLAGLYEPCTRCAPFVGSDGAAHVRCLPR